MTRLWGTGELISVELDAQQVPSTFEWRGEAHQVDSVANRWRVDTQWWSTRPIWREYWKLTTCSGLLVALYCDLLDNRWYLQRLYD